MDGTASEDLRSQVHTALRALAQRESNMHRLDVAFGHELAETERLDLAEVVGAARLLRHYRRQVDVLGTPLPDEQAVIQWAVEQDEFIGEKELAIAGSAHLKVKCVR